MRGAGVMGAGRGGDASRAASGANELERGRRRGHPEDAPGLGWAGLGREDPRGARLGTAAAGSTQLRGARRGVPHQEGGGLRVAVPPHPPGPLLHAR